MRGLSTPCGDAAPATRYGGSVATRAAALPFLTRCTSAMCVLSPQSRRWLPRIHRSPGWRPRPLAGARRPSRCSLHALGPGARRSRDGWTGAPRRFRAQLSQAFRLAGCDSDRFSSLLSRLAGATHSRCAVQVAPFQSPGSDARARASSNHVAEGVEMASPVVQIPGRRISHGETFYTDWMSRGGDCAILRA